MLFYLPELERTIRIFQNGIIWKKEEEWGVIVNEFKQNTVTSVFAFFAYETYIQGYSSCMV